MGPSITARVPIIWLPRSGVPKLARLLSRNLAVWGTAKTVWYHLHGKLETPIGRHLLQPPDPRSHIHARGRRCWCVRGGSVHYARVEGGGWGTIFIDTSKPPDCRMEQDIRGKAKKRRRGAALAACRCRGYHRIGFLFFPSFLFSPRLVP